MTKNSTNPALNKTYQIIQACIGVLTFSLPVLTLGGVWVSGQEQPDSISTAYFTHTHGILVGGLCAIGFLFFAYQRRGYAIDPDDNAKGLKWFRPEYRADRWLSIFSGAGAAIVALVPTSNCQNRSDAARCAVWGWAWVPGFVHACATAVLMACVAILCLRQFVRTSAPPAQPAGGMPNNSRGTVCAALRAVLTALRTFLVGIFRAVPHIVCHPVAATHRTWKWMVDVPTAKPPPSIKRRRANVVYRVCGIVIVVCVLYVVGLGILDVIRDWNLKSANGKFPRLKRPVALIEAIAFWSFGVAWLTKSDYLSWEPWPRLVPTPTDSWLPDQHADPISPDISVEGDDTASLDAMPLPEG